jgi:hypothetical protein
MNTKNLSYVHRKHEILYKRNFSYIALYDLGKFNLFEY